MQMVTPKQLQKLLLHVAPTRPVFIWVPPGIGKSVLVEGFAREVGIDCVSLLAYGTSISTEEVAMLAEGCLSPQHARGCGAFIRQINGKLRVDLILKGEPPLPRAAADRDVLYFIVQSIRAQLAKELPPERDDVQPQHRTLFLLSRADFPPAAPIMIITA